MNTKKYLNNLWRWKSYIPELPITSKPPTLKHIFAVNWSAEFERFMRNRLAMGFFRYGPLAEQGNGAYDVLGAIEKRISRYRVTGNDEILVDVANLCMVEYLKGVHPKKHFSAEDDGEHVEKRRKN